MPKSRKSTVSKTELTPTAELAAIIAETHEDIKHKRNLSPPVGKNNVVKYLEGFRK